MKNVIGLGISNGETELRKRYINGNNIVPGIDNDSIKTNSEQAKPFLERQPMTTNTTPTINEHSNATTTKPTDMTMSTLAGFTNTNTNTNINTTTKAKTKFKSTTTTTKLVRTPSSMITKRSLSESSAEEYHRSCEETSDNSSSQRKMWHNELIINSNSEERQSRRRQRPNNDVGCVNKHNKRNYFISDMIDIGIRLVISVIFIKLETSKAFERNIHIEELWLYKNPRTPDIVPPVELILAVVLGPFIVSLLQLCFTRDWRDFRSASWCWTLCLGLNGISTSFLKISTGRPRPDFFYRCFPDGQMLANVTPTAVNFNCTGKWHDINEGYKSFPSGHSSFAFASFGFISLYLAGKLHAFNSNGRGESWRLCASVWPLFCAALVGISRTCDYHHHWQDVLVGAIIGILFAYLSYRQYYPSIFSTHSHRPLPRDGRTSISYEYGSHHRKYDYIDDSHTSGSGCSNRCPIEIKEKRLITEDQMPLICDEDEDEVEQLNNG